MGGFPIFVGIEYYSLQGVDAIEILNGSTLSDATMVAVQYARKSDSHNG